MSIRGTIVILTAYIVQLVLYFCATIVFHAQAVALLSSPLGARTPGLGAFESDLNLVLQYGLAAEGLIILLAFILHPFRRQPESARL